MGTKMYGMRLRVRVLPKVLVLRCQLDRPPVRPTLVLVVTLMQLPVVRLVVRAPQSEVAQPLPGMQIAVSELQVHKLPHQVSINQITPFIRGWQLQVSHHQPQLSFVYIYPFVCVCVWRLFILRETIKTNLAVLLLPECMRKI